MKYAEQLRLRIPDIKISSKSVKWFKRSNV